MKIWITGARGFIGRQAAMHFRRCGDEPVGLGHGAWPEDGYRSFGLADWLNGEVSSGNLDVLRAKHGPPDAIVHLAGGSAVGASFSTPAEDFRRTVVATAALTEWTRRHSPDAPIILASSAAVYGSGFDGPIPAGAPCAPYSPYGYHKRMAELCLESYARSFGLRVATVRLFSVYGEGLRKQLLWDICTRLRRDPTGLELSGTGDELRDWTHVTDAVRLLHRAVTLADEHAPVFDGATAGATTVREVAKHLMDRWGVRGGPRFSGSARAGDPRALVASREAIAWGGSDPRVPWRAGMDDYVAWFRSQH